LSNNPAVSTIRSVNVYTTNMTSKYIGDTVHIPCICTHLDISSPKSMAFHVEWVTQGTHTQLYRSDSNSTDWKV
jgi:hypothetical protein